MVLELGGSSCFWWCVLALVSDTLGGFFTRVFDLRGLEGVGNFFGSDAVSWMELDGYAHALRREDRGQASLLVECNWENICLDSLDCFSWVWFILRNDFVFWLALT